MDSLLLQDGAFPGSSQGQDADGARLTASLARGARERTGAALGLAVHGVPGDEKPAENLARGTSYLALDGVIGGQSVLRERTYSYAGRGLSDRRRLTLNALNMVRDALMGKADSPRD